MCPTSQFCSVFVVSAPRSWNSDNLVYILKCIIQYLFYDRSFSTVLLSYLLEQHFMYVLYVVHSHLCQTEKGLVLVIFICTLNSMEEHKL